MPKEDIVATIQKCGGTVSQQLSAQVDFVLSCTETAHVLDNPYKLQFHPELKEQIELYEFCFFVFFFCFSGFGRRP